MKTELIIKVTIRHDTPKMKYEALDIWCDGLKEGQNVSGLCGNGESFDLKVVNIKERQLK